MWQKIVLGVLVGLITYYLYKAVFNPKIKSRKSLEALKNSLLAHALMRTKRADFDDFNLNYASFDGTKLPMMSGCSVSNACFTYIITKDDFRKNPFYTRVMEGKIDAVDKYLECNFDTDEKVLAFFEKYIESLDTTDGKHVDTEEDCASEVSLNPNPENTKAVVDEPQADVDVELIEKPTVET